MKSLQNIWETSSWFSLMTSLFTAKKIARSYWAFKNITYYPATTQVFCQGIKMCFAQQSVNYLWHIISGLDVSVDLGDHG